MVVRAMLSDGLFQQISRCDKSLNFGPRRAWPSALPVFSWRGLQLSGFERRDVLALDLSAQNGCTFGEAFLACYPELGLGELARLNRCLQRDHLELSREFSEPLFAHYDLRWSERLQQTLVALAQTPLEFQAWVDDKNPGVRELAPLLALDRVEDLAPLLRELVARPLSKSQAMQAMEWVIELFMMGRPLSDLLPSGDNMESYLRQLEQWRKPRSAASDEQWRQTVVEWPWPAQVQGQWQRFGDQAGLEIKIRTTSPQDFHKKLERLLSIRETWSSKQ